MKFIVAIFLLVSVFSCSFFKPKPDGTPTTCSAMSGTQALKDVTSVILGVVVTGISSGFSVESMIAALESLAVEYAPGIWNCAMNVVANENVSHPSLTSELCTSDIAKEYLHRHPVQ